MNYRWDSQLHLFQSDRTVRFEYSDGIDIEQRLLDAVTTAADRGTFSSELARHVRDWPSEYHLSRRRHCLLRPLHIKHGARVLELGCGCGAITRYLGEVGANVVAVEGSLMRARIAAQRSRELANVRVVVDDLLHFAIDEQFDYVLLIGVLEYAARFSSAANPFESYLEVVRRFLARDGKVVIAIENQLGLKYLNGCTEDHVGARFYGVQDLYTGDTARTFGRQELSSLLRSASLPNLQFYYPFPDYKLPSVILSEDALGEPDFNAGDVIAHCHARDYNASPYRAFDEALVADVVYRNGLLADLSNSFLVVAGAERAEAEKTRELAFSWSVDRVPELCTETTFVRQQQKIVVLKRPLHGGTSNVIRLPGELTIRYEPRATDYRQGRQLLTELKRVRARSGRLDEVVEALRPLMAYLLRHAHTAQQKTLGEASSDIGHYRISGNFLDCTPSNLLSTGQELVRIDEEWNAEGDIPLAWVVVRGLIWSLMSGLPADHQIKSVEDVAQALCREYNISISNIEGSQWMELEAAFQSAVTGRLWSAADLRHTSGGMQSFNRAIELMNELQSSLSVQSNELAELRRALTVRDEDMKRFKGSVAASDAEISRARVREQTLRAQLAKANYGMGGRLSSILTSGGRKSRRQLKQDAELIRRSNLFDRQWYLSRNSDVAGSGTDPVLHYLEHGGFEGRDPSPDFHSQWYLDQNDDVRAGGMNPLLHYLRFGSKEGRRSKP